MATKKVTGLAEAFADKEFSKSWEVEHNNTNENGN